MGNEVSWHVKAACLVLATLLPVAVLARSSDDYQNGAAASAAAKAYFKAVPQTLESYRISRRASAAAGEDGAYFTEDGGISIPPGAMIVFKVAGKCMDPHLPAPRGGEPMQFVDVGELIPVKLRIIYDILMERSAQGDPKVRANNLQHLVWALRTAGTDDPIANSLSAAQIDFLDECAGRRGTFLKYHEKEKRKNARRARKSGPGGLGRISVGGYSYDAADLRGTNGTRRIEQHIATLTEMGEKATETTDSDFRYGEIADELYSDITCDGGLSFTAKVLNASARRRAFRAADFAAQVGNGQVAGSRRQRVTMSPPDEFMVVMGAAQEGVEFDRNLSIAEVEGAAHQRVRGRSYGRRGATAAEGHSRTTRKRERTQKTRRETTVTNEITVAEEVAMRVTSLEYDARARTGVLTVEILRGSFKEANKYIREKLDDLVRMKSPAEDAAKIPADINLEIESIAIHADNHCEVRFKAR